MASITFYLKEFEHNGFDINFLKDTLPKIGVEVENITKDQINVEITPNRPDLLDQQGVIRALQFFSNEKLPEDDYKISGESKVVIEVTAKARKIRPFIGCVAIKEISLNDQKLTSIINFSEKLSSTYGRKRKKLAIGMHDLNKVEEGGLTYDAGKDQKFIPLGHEREMTLQEALKASSKGIEFVSAVPDSGSKGIPFLSDRKKILSMIPIINSEATRVTEKTTSLLIDATGTSRAAVSDAINMLACSFIDMGAKVYSCRIRRNGKEETTPNFSKEKIKIGCGAIERTLGVKILPDDAAKLSIRMGYSASKQGKGIVVEPPPYRTDIFNAQDVIEDIGIAYGYDRIKQEKVPSLIDGSFDGSIEHQNRLALAMVGLGFMEAVNSKLTNEKANFDMMERKYDKKSIVTIAESKTESITMLRTDLLPQLLQNLLESSSEPMPQRIFEIGEVFRVDGEEPKTSTRLAFAAEHSKANFSEIKSTVEAIMTYMNIKAKIEDAEDGAFIKGRTAAILAGGKRIGVFGEMHPQVLSNMHIEEPVIAAEIEI
jgi:phenylalanyl-tRNA synthetase beta chain